MRASRAVLRRVLADRAAVLTANAQEALSSESILGGQILSVGIGLVAGAAAYLGLAALIRVRELQTLLSMRRRSATTSEE